MAISNASALISPSASIRVLAGGGTSQFLVEKAMSWAANANPNATYHLDYRLSGALNWISTPDGRTNTRSISVVPGNYQFRLATIIGGATTVSSIATAFVGESSNGDIVPAAATPLVNSVGEEYTIVNGKVGINGNPDNTTANVVLLYYSKATNPGRIYFQSSLNNTWFWKTQSSNPSWTGPVSDPRPVAPPAPPPPPPSSSAVMIYNPGVATTPGPGNGPNGITFNLNVPTAAYLNRAIFGSAATSFGNERNGRWDFELLGDVAFQASVRTMGLKFLRLHPSTALQETFPSFPNTADQDWTTFNTLTKARLDACFPGAEFMMNIQYSQHITDNPSAVASAYAIVAQRLKNQNVFIKYWSPCNEAELSGYSSAQIANLLAIVKPAIKAVDPNFLVGGTDTTNQGGNITTVTRDGHGEFINWHSYMDGSTNPIDDDGLINGVQLGGNFTGAVQFGEAARGNQLAAKAGAPGNYIAGNSEWNMDSYQDGNPNRNPRMNDYIGALWQTTMRIHSAWSGASFCAQFRLNYPDGYYPIMQGFAPFGFYPPGFALKALNDYLPAGNLVSQSLNRSDGFGKMSAMCSVDNVNSILGAVIVNRDPSLSWTGPITFAGRTNATGAFTRFTLGVNNQNGITTSNVVASSLSSVTIPAKSMLILNGAR